jgi:hypothetical protein
MSKRRKSEFVVPGAFPLVAGLAVLEIGFENGIDDAGGRLGDQGDGVSEAGDSPAGDFPA